VTVTERMSPMGREVREGDYVVKERHRAEGKTHSKRSSSAKRVGRSAVTKKGALKREVLLGLDVTKCKKLLRESWVRKRERGRGSINAEIQTFRRIYRVYTKGQALTNLLLVIFQFNVDNLQRKSRREGLN